MKRLFFMLSLVVFLFGVSGCEKSPVETRDGKGGDEVLGGLADTLIGKWILVKITHTMDGKNIYATDERGMSTVRIFGINADRAYIYKYESHETDFVQEGSFSVLNDTRYLGRFILFSDRSEDCELKFYSEEKGSLFMTIDDTALDGGLNHYKKISEVANE